MAHPNSRLRQFELQLADDRRQQKQRQRSAEEHPSRRQRSRNTLAPQEDVVEGRLHRKRVTMSEAPVNSSGGMLMENIVMLLLLSASIYGIYRLCIYILNQ